ncbi:MAG: adenylyltransferase/cytidyltransferase family protein [Planctomycetota bacterium]|jgi:rfaE bifunctional protein nucleotidyltransferase chain/domain
MPGGKRIESWDALKEVVARLRRANKTIAFTNGCFEILHVGHLRSLEAARENGDCLIVGVNSDASVRRYKGRGDPVVCESERAEILAGLRCVDYVYIFDEATVDGLLNEIRPDAYCKGPEYTMENLPERETLRRIGGRLVAVGGPKDHSTTDLLQKIAGMHKDVGALGVEE